jgi:hypothetical protein
MGSFDCFLLFINAIGEAFGENFLLSAFGGKNGEARPSVFAERSGDLLLISGFLPKGLSSNPITSS